MSELAECIADAIDAHLAVNPDLTVLQVLTALEDVRHGLTEAFLRDAPVDYGNARYQIAYRPRRRT